MTLEITDAMVDAAIGEHDPMVFKHGTPDAHRDHMRDILSAAIAVGEIIRKPDKADMPAVVEAMTKTHFAERLKWRGHGQSWEEGCVNPDWEKSKYEAMESALSAALATGSVVICSPDKHRFGSPPEPMTKPSEAWCDAYAAWYYQAPE